MNSITKFLIWNIYIGLLFLGIGLGIWINVGAGIAASGLILSLYSFIVGYEPNKKEDAK